VHSMKPRLSATAPAQTVATDWPVPAPPCPPAE
jgi:hypothetical protein